MNGRNRELLAHLSIALSRYTKERGRNGLAMSEDLLALAEFFESCATARQDATQLGGMSGTSDAESMTNHPVLTKREAAAALRVSPRTVDRLIASGALVAVRLGGATRVRRTDLDKYIDSLDDNRSFRENVAKKETA